MGKEHCSGEQGESEGPVDTTEDSSDPQAEQLLEEHMLCVTASEYGAARPEVRLRRLEVGLRQKKQRQNAVEPWLLLLQLPWKSKRNKLMCNPKMLFPQN